MSDDALPGPGIILHPTEDGRTRLRCGLGKETAWRTQALLAERFETGSDPVNDRLNAISAEGDLRAEAPIRGFRNVPFQRRMNP